jgi:tol-pal system protein YbgF
MNLRIFIIIFCLFAALPVCAQRTSLADRVAALEQQAASQTQGASQANIELLNKSTQMQDEIRQLRASIEQLQNELEQTRQRNREQYIDLESRVNSLEQSPSATKPVPVVSSAKPTSKPATAVAPAPAAESAAYQAAHNSLIKQGDAVTASRQFQDFLQTYPDSKLAPNAWYWLGESYYITQNYPLALKSFEILNQQYPDSSKAPDALLKTAYCHIELKETDKGKKELEQLIATYPNHPVADMARGRLRGLSLGQ